MKICPSCSVGIWISSKQCRSCNMKALHADSVFAKARDERIKALHADPVFAKARDERIKALHADPVFAKARDERLKALNVNPVFVKILSERMRERIKALHADPVFAKALSERMRERAKSIQANHPELRLNGYGKKTMVDGHTFPSRAEARSFTALKSLGGCPQYNVKPIETPFGRTYPDTILERSIFDIPAGIPIELKAKDGSYPWSEAQIWAIENGEMYLVCAEDLPRGNQQ